MNPTNFSNSMNNSFVIEKDPNSVSLYLCQTEVAGVITFLAFFGFIRFLKNLVVILSIVLTDGFLDVPANIFVLSLAFSDLLVCGVGAPLLIYNCFHWYFTVFITVNKFIVVATTGSIFLITLNRLVSVVRPLKYSAIITRERTLAMLGCMWIVAALFPTLATIGLIYNIKAMVHLTRYILTFYMLSSSAMYVYMYILARRQKEKLSKQNNAITGQLQSSVDEFKALRTLLLVAGSFAACWSPMTIGFFFTDRYKSPKTFYRTFNFTAPLVVLNAALDPIIYYFKKKGFKHSLKILVRNFRNKGCCW